MVLIALARWAERVVALVEWGRGGAVVSEGGDDEGVMGDGKWES